MELEFKRISCRYSSTNADIVESKSGASRMFGKAATTELAGLAERLARVVQFAAEADNSADKLLEQQALE